MPNTALHQILQALTVTFLPDWMCFISTDIIISERHFKYIGTHWVKSSEVHSCLQCCLPSAELLPWVSTQNPLTSGPSVKRSSATFPNVFLFRLLFTRALHFVSENNYVSFYLKLSFIPLSESERDVTVWSYPLLSFFFAYPSSSVCKHKHIQMFFSSLPKHRTLHYTYIPK